MATAAERQRQYQERREGRGETKVAVWLDAPLLAALDAARGPEARAVYIRAMLAAHLREAGPDVVQCAVAGPSDDSPPAPHR